MPQTKTYTPGRCNREVMREMLGALATKTPHEHSWRNDMSTDSVECEFFCGARIDRHALLTFKEYIPDACLLNDPRVSGFLDLLLTLNGQAWDRAKRAVEEYFATSK